jgi:hypothetical protein
LWIDAGAGAATGAATAPDCAAMLNNIMPTIAKTDFFIRFPLPLFEVAPTVRLRRDRPPVQRGFYGSAMTQSTRQTPPALPLGTARLRPDVRARDGSIAIFGAFRLPIVVALFLCANRRNMPLGHNIAENVE